MAKKTTTIPEVIDSAEALEASLQALREAQKKFSSYSQEQVDRIFFESAMAANKARIPPGQNGRGRNRNGRCGRQGDQKSLRCGIYLQLL